MSQSVLLKASGLYTFPSHLSAVPQGALLEASNIIINRDNTIESRRGQKLYGTEMGGSPTTDTAHQLFSYKGRIMRHFGSGAGTTIEYDTGTTDVDGNEVFSAFSGTFLEVIQGLRIKSIESNSNFYFTSSNGIKKISVSSAAGLATASITNAGGIKALDVQATLNPEPGFLQEESVIAYRTVWGIKDANNNIILGVPSSRTVLANPLTDLLITDFNNLLASLDTLNVATGIHAQNYLTTYKVAVNSTSSTLRANMISMASAIDTDIPGFTVTNTVVTGSGPYQVTLTVSTDPTTIISTGDPITLSGFTPSTYNGNFIVDSTSSTTIVYTTPIDPTAYTSGGAVKRTKYASITEPVVITSGTTDQLQSLQNYYSTIVSDLQNEPVGVVVGTPFSGNNAITSATVNLKFVIPSEITTAHFYQVYRTAQVISSTGITLGSLDPGDEEQLVFESNPTTNDISNGFIQLQDITPDSFRGANLYTNPDTGDGILQANDIPPLAKDIASFKGYTFYANTQTRHSLNISMLSVIDLVTATSKLTITDGITTNTYTFVSGVAQVQTVSTVADVSGSLNSKYFILWSGKNQTKYYVWYNINGAGVDPAIADATGIEVAAGTNASANDIALATQIALNSFGDFSISVLANIVHITNNTAGISTQASNGAASPGFSYFIITAGTGEDTANKKILISSLPTPAQEVDESARSLVRVINSNPNEIVYAFYLSGPTDVPGLILLEAKNLDESEFYLLANNSATGAEFNPPISPTKIISNISIANPTIITSNGHGLSNNDEIVISGSNSTPNIDGIYQISNVTSNTFTINVNVTIGGNIGGFILKSDGNVSSNEVLPNRIYYSKFQQPEAVPIVNFLDVGPQDKAIVRILALRDSLYVLKEEAIYRISGLEAPFTITLADSSSQIKAPDSAVVLNNLIYMYSTQGVATVSDTGVSVISRPIENQLLKLINFNNFTTATFGVSYESDRSYYLWTLTKIGDDFATQCFKYNSFTDAWTTNDLSARCGIINDVDDKLYLGPADINFISQERKNFDRTDYADREILVDLSSSSINGNSIDIGTSVDDISEGDVFIQTQHLTIAQYNQILTKLDIDSKLTDRNYLSTLGATIGASLSNSVDSLIAKIANDSGRLSVSGFTPAATYTALSPCPIIFANMQSTYNDLINLLNNDVGVGYKNYTHSTGTVDYEFIIQSTDTESNSIISQYTYPILVQGPGTVFKKIICEVQWVPQYMTDVSMSKQVSESTMIFEDSSFTKATISFSSDLSSNYESQDIPGFQNGIYGNSIYGVGIYGGNGSGIPFRTLIPKEKQRCRYLNIKFDHSVAREEYALYGISLTYNPVSQRAYR